MQQKDRLCAALQRVSNTFDQHKAQRATQVGTFLRHAKQARCQAILCFGWTSCPLLVGYGTCSALNDCPADATLPVCCYRAAVLTSSVTAQPLARAIVLPLFLSLARARTFRPLVLLCSRAMDNVL